MRSFSLIKKLNECYRQLHGCRHVGASVSDGVAGLACTRGRRRGGGVGVVASGVVGGGGCHRVETSLTSGNRVQPWRRRRRRLYTDIKHHGEKQYMYMYGEKQYIHRPTCVHSG